MRMSQEQETAMYDQPEQPEQSDTERTQEFDDFLDDVYEPVKIWGQTFTPSDILFKCDPIAYRCYRADWEEDIQIERN